MLDSVRARGLGRRSAVPLATLALVLAAAGPGCNGDVGGPGGSPDGGGAPRADGSTARRDGAVPTADGGPGGTDAGPSGVDAGGGVDAGPSVDPCEAIAGASYDTLSRSGDATDRPPAEHGDLNVKLRGWSSTGGTLGLIDISGPTDTLAPKLNTLFTDDRVPTFVANYQVNQWDWGCNCRGGAITDWDVTMSGFGTTPGEVIELPDSGYDIGGAHDALVLYADDDSITLKYTREDNVVYGYTVHLVGVCVEPSLRALYDSSDAGGRVDLPALRGNQPLGRARGTEVLVAIRDTGAFMDPRSRKDWW